MDWDTLFATIGLLAVFISFPFIMASLFTGGKKR